MVRKCEVCGERTSKYICQECGRAICESCMKPDTWLCLDCYEKSETQGLHPLGADEVEITIPIPIKLFFVGFMLIFIGAIILTITTLFYGTKGSFGLIFLLGPIPIILGSGENVMPILVIAAMLTIACLLVFLIFRKR